MLSTSTASVSSERHASPDSLLLNVCEELKDYVLSELSLLKGLCGTSAWCWKASVSL